MDNIFYNIRCIVDRIKTEAESMDDMHKMIQAELDALYELYKKEKPVKLYMYSKTEFIEDKDYVSVGIMSAGEYGTKVYNIVPYSYIDTAGVYVVKYKPM
jgi:hypothetical protein